MFTLYFADEVVFEARRKRQELFESITAKRGRIKYDKKFTMDLSNQGLFFNMKVTPKSPSKRSISNK